MKKNIFILCFLMLLTTTVFAQRETNKQALEQIAIEQEIIWKQANERAKKFANENNIELRTEFENGRVIELIDVIDGQPVFNTTFNIDAAATTRANKLWDNVNFGGGLTGSGFDKVAVWDGGKVRNTHQEFNDTGTSRVTLGDNASSLSAHATHVTGTIAAAGVKADAKGMAFEANVKTYDWNNDISEMATAASQGFLISNHSYGLITGWYQSGWTWTWYGNSNISPLEDHNFGYYSSGARNVDVVCYNAPYYLPVIAAGNDRGEGPSNAGTGNNPEKDGGDDGYDCISNYGIGKNVLTVGAVRKVSNYTGPQSVSMSYFSGWGPTDDGRIKPDVVGAGVDVYSCSSSSNTSYTSMSGTSMASPNVTGSLTLLHQYYLNLYGNPMRSATIKALAIHTAEECGTYEGPDYRFGWGLLNVERAAGLIKNKNLHNVISEQTLQNEQTYERTINVSANEPLRVTICWTDPAGPVHAAALNNRAPVLVNDLDLIIVDMDDNSYYPYKLDPENPGAPATKNSTNDVDNVEQAYIENPVEGKYKIIVTHKGTLQNDSQDFSIIVSCDFLPIGSDATLKSLTVNPGTLEPSFAPLLRNYTVTVPFEVSTISITGTAKDEYATVNGNVIDEELEVGENTFNIVVIAENNFTQLTYTVVVTREEIVLSDDATLSDIIISEGVLTPDFSTEITEYSAIVPYEITTISITGVANDPTATIEGNITDAELIVGDNPFNIIVTAEDEITSITYSINIIREEPIYYTIISSVNGQNGTIEPKGTHQYLQGESVTYFIKPDEGYLVNEVFLDGNNIGSDSTYVFTDIDSDHEIVVSFISSSSIKEYDVQTIKIYPNPAKNYIIIESEEIINEIIIFNFSGKELLRDNNIREKSFRIELGDYPTGIYYLRINNITKKLVVE